LGWSETGGKSIIALRHASTASRITSTSRIERVLHVYRLLRHRHHPLEPSTTRNAQIAAIARGAPNRSDRPGAIIAVGTQRNGLSHFDARHPLPTSENMLAALSDEVTVAAVERLCRQGGVRFQIGRSLFMRRPLNFSK
jgi:hypothetical protein